ncbi:TSC22 domain family protein 3 [Merluccius polli]|uniref:TSC22 domain family protein 1 n=1 Tax=Merluccius polli TaxID=89951 RepID=A0AA47NAH8_MERPO|nr:TSC22 domain family protein 3 [Merluccius polli]KAK0155453.1 TSC22 domain family protein 3 [Merluccius polli]
MNEGDSLDMFGSVKEIISVLERGQDVPPPPSRPRPPNTPPIPHNALRCLTTPTTQRPSVELRVQGNVRGRGGVRESWPGAKPPLQNRKSPHQLPPCTNITNLNPNPTNLSPTNSTYPTNSTNPTNLNPTNSTYPTNSTNSFNPTYLNPTNATNPTNPTNSTNSTNPAYHNLTNSTNPTNSTNSTNPTNSTNHTYPSPTNLTPTNSTNHANSTNPTNSTNPSPTNLTPTSSTNPTNSTRPINSTESSLISPPSGRGYESPVMSPPSGRSCPVMSDAGMDLHSIDTKIQQAMDLVKGHLQQAVKEEMVILQQQITELQDRNNQLQRENYALRSLLNTH